MCIQLHLVFFFTHFFHLDMCYVYSHVFMYVGLHVCTCMWRLRLMPAVILNPSLTLFTGAGSQSNLELADMTNFTGQLALGGGSHLCLLRLEL